MTDPSPASGATSPASDPSIAYRLPYSVEPLRYDVRLVPDLDAGSFRGDVAITARAHESTSRIVLNAAELDVKQVRVTGPRGEDLAVRFKAQEDEERLAIELSAPLGPCEIQVDISFTGILNDQLHGFYRSTFVDLNGDHRTIATTQFEATDARRAFPCFDEPDRKAVFAITLDVPDGMAAFSNSPVAERRQLDDGLIRFRFADTMKMSTYLVACVVGDFAATEPLDVDGVPVRIVHVPGKGDLCSYALEVAAHALRFYSEWFGLDYPAQKLDLLAIPDFAFGAMENLGCVTFREVLLLVDPQRASRMELQRIADVISHEIAHMWFGDLVTMKWWNGIWLNEAFATFMEVACVDAFRPQWKRWTSFGNERAAAMATDALHTTRPVEYPVGRPEEAEGMFDVLTYEKGASVLRMLEQYLGAERFREGVRRYLKAHSYSNTETSDLWDAIEAATKEPVRDIMDSWIFQGGFPLVSLTQGDEARGGHLLVEQQPFSLGPARSDSSIGTRWLVPLVTRSLGDRAQEEKTLLTGENVELDEAPPVLLNAHGNGYYRVRYQPGQLLELARRVTDLEALELSNLVSDAWAGVVAGTASLGSLLPLLGALSRVDDPDVWLQVTSALDLLHHTLDDEALPVLARYCRESLRGVFGRIGWEPAQGEDERIPSLRAQLLAVLGTIGEDPEVVARADRSVRAELEGTSSMDPDLAGALVTVVASHGAEEEFDAFLDRMRNAATPQEEMRYRQALAAFGSPALARRAFELALHELRTQDAPYLVQLLLTNRHTGELTWQLLRDNWDEMMARIPSNSPPRMLMGLRLLCRSRDLATEIKSFCAEHPLRSGGRTMEQTLERMMVNVAFAERLHDEGAGAVLADAVSLSGERGAEAP